jgi:hypothetical protein
MRTDSDVGLGTVLSAREARQGLSEPVSRRCALLAARRAVVDARSCRSLCASRSTLQRRPVGRGAGHRSAGERFANADPDVLRACWSRLEAASGAKLHRWGRPCSPTFSPPSAQRPRPRRGRCVPRSSPAEAVTRNFTAPPAPVSPPHFGRWSDALSGQRERIKT